MKALISGSSGFVGRHLIEALQKKGYAVGGIPRSIYYNHIALKDYFMLMKPDYIFHLAAYGNMAHQSEIMEMINANITGTLNMLFASADVNYKAFVNVSTSSVLLPHETFYSATKAAGERLCKAFVDKYNKPIVSIRPYSLYGEGEAEFRFIPTVFRSCLDGEEMKLDPNPVHDWVYVGDFVNFLIKNAEIAEKLEGATINFGTGKGTTNKQVVELIELLTGKKANIKEEEMMREFDNNEWVSEDIGETISLPNGLNKVYEYYQQRSQKENFTN